MAHFSDSKIAPVGKASTIANIQDTFIPEKVRKDSQVLNRIKQLNQTSGCNVERPFSPRNNPDPPSFPRKNPPSLLPKNSTDIYLLNPEDLPDLPSPPDERPREGSNPLFRASVYPRNTQHGQADWRKKASKLMNKERFEEFEYEVVIASNQPNIEKNLQKKPEGTYVIHKGLNNNNMLYPYTIYRCIEGSFGRSQVIKTNIRCDSTRKTYRADGYGNNHPSLRDLVDSNKVLLKREFYERLRILHF